MNGPTETAPLMLDTGPLRLRQCRHGMMLFLRMDEYIGRSFDLYGEFSEAEFEILGQLIKPGQVVVDAGANIGAHTVFFSRAVGAQGRVYAFEPQRYLHQVLCANLALNDLRNVIAAQAALGAVDGTILVPRPDYDRSQNFGGISLAGAAVGGEKASLQTIDSLRLNQCDLIKADVEGMELEVLKGAAATIRRFRPALFLENDRPDRSGPLIEKTLSLGYRLYWHVSPLFNPANFFGNPENVFGGTVSISMLGLPASAGQSIPLPEILSPDDWWLNHRATG